MMEYHYAGNSLQGYNRDDLWNYISAQRDNVGYFYADFDTTRWNHRDNGIIISNRSDDVIGGNNFTLAPGSSIRLRRSRGLTIRAAYRRRGGNTSISIPSFVRIVFITNSRVYILVDGSREYITISRN